MVPEEVVGDEDAVSHRRKVLDDGADGTLAKGTAIELPDGAEVAPERQPRAVSTSQTGLKSRQWYRLRSRSTRSRAGNAARSRPVRSARCGVATHPSGVRRRSAGTEDGGRPEASASASAGTTSSPSSTQIPSRSGVSRGAE